MYGTACLSLKRQSLIVMATILKRCYTARVGAMPSVITSYINGEKVPFSRHGDVFPKINPATREEDAQILSAGPRGVDDAVQAARRAFPGWSAMPHVERSRLLLRAAGLIRERVEALAYAEVADTGKPLREALGVDVYSAADALEYFAHMSATLHGTHHTALPGAASPYTYAYTRREPLGVVGAIGAWNYPIQISAWKSAAAMAAGNTVVFKPSELTPTTAGMVAEILSEAGVPAGVYNVVQGKGDVGHALATHPDVAKIGVTGSCATGKAVSKAAADTLKHVTLELGGKSPLILFDDCDMPKAVAGALYANFYSQGEVCSNGTRVFVQRPILDAFTKAVVSATQQLKVGDPMDLETHIGALISEQHMAKVLGFIEDGVKEGATLLLGGQRARVPGKCSNGYFVEPTIFGDCTDGMRMVREEVFGPVMCILPFDTEEEVVARANDTSYGLAAGVFTKSQNRAHRVVAQLEAGTCWINSYNVTPVEVPFGGFKASGIGKENGLGSIEQFTRLKSVYVDMSDEAPAF